MLISVLTLMSDRGSETAWGTGVALNGEEVWFTMSVRAAVEALLVWGWNGPLLIEVDSMSVGTYELGK